MKSVFAIVGVLTLASCSSTEEIFNENIGDNDNSVKMTFTASQEERATTRTGIGIDNGTTKIWWSDGDKIKVFNSSESSEFELSEGENTTTAKFTGSITEADTYYAIYPSQDNVYLSGNRFIGVQLKAEQTATQGSFDPEAAIMVAKSDDTNFQFKNVISYFKVTPTYDCTEIVVTAHKSTDALAGTFDVTLGSDGTPSISNITEGNREVKLTGDIKANNDYYILLLPGTFEYGFSVTLQPKSDLSKKYFKQRTTSLTLNSNDLWNLGTMSGTTLVDESTIPYITLSASGTHTISLIEGAKADGLQYSVGNGAWTNMTAGSTVSYGGTNKNLRLRAKNPSGISGLYSSTNYTYTTFTFGDTTGEVQCTGDIRTLIDYDNYYDVNTSTAIFSGLLSGFTQLNSAPKLPIMELASFCYHSMFNGCTSLTTAPELPASRLATFCYTSMFKECTSLVSAPVLPATILEHACYHNMFFKCTSLTLAPELNATTLAEHCYNSMFCYCSKLEKVTMLATDISAENCLKLWLNYSGDGVASRTLKLANQNIYDTINTYYLPDNWKQGAVGTTVQFQNQQ